ncbi:protocadherin alpha-5-like [Podarcis lilfordi]|uniref:Protocadherin alpha-5-like n=1 Tax=Podarcis lilfordi TaxID=74358 RepID=A0AA35PCL9_9SAUR|nr:protocadherin alpha-5-like [Podarcis lilfordi]
METERRQLLQLMVLHAAWMVGSGQLHYSVPEESQHGTFVGRIAQDLGLEVEELVPRMFRMVSKGQEDYFEVNVQNGVLFVNSRIDREQLCAQSPICIIHLEMIVDKPLRIFHAEVEIRDINDNAPIFPVNEHQLFILESRLLGSYFPLEGASDADIGSNGLLTYILSPNDYFQLREEKHGDLSKSLALVLYNALDREKISVHHLLLTATDGGQPELTGSVQLKITVLDVNDNVPMFNQSVYEVHLLENITEGTSVITLTAYDLDEGTNKEILYSFSNMMPPHLRQIFSIDSNTGEIKIKGKIDFEDINLFELQVEAADQGSYSLVGHCKVLIQVLDVNDNAPELSVTSMSVPVPEDSPLGTVVALMSISDSDAGINAQVSCSLWPHGLPFRLISTFKNYYSLVLAESLDREEVAEYRLVVTVQDQGTPSLSASSSLVVPIGDVNDNAPAFPQPSYTVFVKENNPPGAHIFTVSASDSDVAENALVSYWLDDKLWPLSSYISVHSESGKLYALQPLDYEEVKLLEFQVRAKDAGLPSLCGNVTVQVFVVDENDNAPEVSKAAEAPILLVVPVTAGHMVGKIHALDADSGYNAWLHYELHEASSSSWRVGLYSGEISTTHALDETEGVGNSMILLVLVKDHGKPVRSTTATLSISLVASTQAAQADAHLSRMGGSLKPLVDTTNIYLIIAICSVSSLFLLAIVVYVALRCQSQLEDGARYGPGTATLVCASEVGSWSYSQRHSRNLGCVAGEAGIKNDLMVFSPNIPVFAVNTGVGNAKELVPNLSGEVSHMEALRIFVTDALVFLSRLNAWHYTIGHHIQRQWGLIALCTSIYLFSFLIKFLAYPSTQAQDRYNFAYNKKCIKCIKKYKIHFILTIFVRILQRSRRCGEFTLPLL